MADQLREALEKVRQRLRADYCLNRLPKTKERQEILDMLDAALSAPPEQPPTKTNFKCLACGNNLESKIHNGELFWRCDSEDCRYFDLWLDLNGNALVTSPGVEQAGSGHTDDYVAWLRWSGDEEHRHLVVCDSDSPRAFKVYRRPND